MHPRLKQSSSLFSFVLLSWIGAPLMAHTVKVVQDVAVTIHVEPNHRPRAGEPAQAWFVLTKAGGEVIPLAECDCQLSVYQEGGSTAIPVLQPPLEAVSAEQYEDIPGAAIVFPQVGAYQLELKGVPTTDDRFQPFAVRFPVTVATGTSVSKVTPPSPQRVGKHPQTTPFPWQQLVTVAIVLFAIGLIGLGVGRFSRRRKS